ncbi:hypothetical protein AGMMS49546_06660 [Spirochaetia bacterium]|nr:hypothetical protein AGMMS49546_06660 [Spirochaetia bacterium]
MSYFRALPGIFLFFILISPLLPQTGDEKLWPGSENTNRESLKTTLRERKIPFEERPLFAEYGGFGSSLLVSLPGGKGPAPGAGLFESPPHTFVLAIPLSGTGSALSDEDPKGAGELPLRFAAALEFIEKIRTRDTAQEALPAPQAIAPLHATDFIIAFLGDEGSLLPPELQKRPHVGFEDLCAGLEDPEDVYLWYLDIQETESAGPGGKALPGRLVIQQGSARGIASLGALKNISGLCAGLNIPWSLRIPFNGLYKLALARGGPPVLDYAHGQAIDAIHVSAAGDGEKAPAITAEALGELIFRYAASLEFSAGRDRRYALIPLPGRTGAMAPALIFVPEPLLVLALLVEGAAFIIAALLFSFRRRKGEKVPVITICAMALILLGTALSAFFDIGFLPVWALSCFFVILGLILRRPLPLFVCTLLAYISLAGLCGLLYIHRGPPPVTSGEEILGPAIEDGEQDPLLAEIKTRMQLERLIIDLTLQFRETPIRFDLSLVSDGDPLLIYSAPMPYLIDGERRSADFFLGEGPPNPLSLELIVSRNFSGFLRAEAIYQAEDEKGERYFQRALREIEITS